VSSDDSALETVYRSSSLALTRLAYLLVGNRAEAEDIVQTVFASAAARWTTIEQPAAYLRRAVVNQAHDSHRRTHRAAVPAAPAGGIVGEPTVDDTLRFVRALPDRQRAVVVLRFYEDLSLTEIASLLDRPDATVRSDLRRALTKLRRSLT
jgi:DNA-directed RNA polymerase specialized sigma24 family protein